MVQSLELVRTKKKQIIKLRTHSLHISKCQSIFCCNFFTSDSPKKKYCSENCRSMKLSNYINTKLPMKKTIQIHAICKLYST